MTNYSERLGLLIEAIVVREAAGTCPVTGEPHPCENRDETDGAACEGCDGPEMAESRAARVGAIFEAARKQSKAAKKAAALKAKYLNLKTGAFKGRKGEKFKNCAAYMKAKGGVKYPKALCGSIARKKALGESTEGALVKTGRKVLPIRLEAGHIVLVQGEKRAWTIQLDEKPRIERDNPDLVGISGTVLAPIAQEGQHMAMPVDAQVALETFTKKAMGEATELSDVDKIDDDLLAAADGTRTLNQNFLLAVAKQVSDSKWVEIKHKGSRVIDIGPKGAALGEAVGWTLAESEEADPRQMIESGDAMIKILEGQIDALRKGLKAAQAELKGYARIGVPQRAASALLKKHLLSPAEDFEDMAKKVRETIEEGIKVFA